MPCLLEVLMIPMIDTITLIPVKTGRVTLTSPTRTWSDSVEPPGYQICQLISWRVNLRQRRC